MRRIGRVLHISPSRKAVIKASKPPRIGKTLFDEDRKPVGKVFDIFGPTKSPYIEVDIRNEIFYDLAGKMLYQLLHSKRNKKGKRRK